jgi:site-specific DNA recombinase
MGRLVLNVLLSFAQFEREVTGERIRDKLAASKKKGMWMGGCPPLGLRHRKTGNLSSIRSRPKSSALSSRGFWQPVPLPPWRWKRASAITAPAPIPAAGARTREGHLFNKAIIYRIIVNPVYIGVITHKGEWHQGSACAHYQSPGVGSGAGDLEGQPQYAPG